MSDPKHWGRPPRKLTELVAPEWERQKGERSKDFAAFMIYRDLPPSTRKLQEVIDRDGRARSTISSLAARFRWEERARLSDDERDRVIRMQQVEQIGDMNERHARNAKALLELMMQPGNALVKKLVGGGQQALEGMDVGELMRLTMSAGRSFTELMRVERLARGETDASVGVREMGMSNTARRIAKDPELVRAAHDILRRSRKVTPDGLARMNERGAPAAEPEPKPHETNGEDEL